MNEQNRIAALARIPLFHNMNARQLTNLARLATVREFPTGAAVVNQGENGVGLFIIIAGRAEAVLHKQDGAQVVVNTFCPNDFFGELALLDEGQRTASVIATEPLQCLALVRWDFLSLLKNDAEMATNVLAKLAMRFRLMLESTQ